MDLRPYPGERTEEGRVRICSISTTASTMNTALNIQIDVWLVKSISLPARIGPVMAAAEDARQYNPVEAPMAVEPARS